MILSSWLKEFHIIFTFQHFTSIYIDWFMIQLWRKIHNEVGSACRRSQIRLPLSSLHLQHSRWQYWLLLEYEYYYLVFNPLLNCWLILFTLWLNIGICLQSKTAEFFPIVIFFCSFDVKWKTCRYDLMLIIKQFINK